MHRSRNEHWWSRVIRLACREPPRTSAKANDANARHLLFKSSSPHRDLDPPVCSCVTWSSVVELGVA
eukprot:1308450-Pyramimonas_sp.AAC.1